MSYLFILSGFIPVFIHPLLSKTGLDNNIIALCYRYTPRTNPDNNFLVHKFNTDGNEISKFGAFQKDFKSLSESNIQGAVHAFNTGVDSLVFLSFGYPYEIRIYDGNRDKFLKRFARKTSFHGKEIIDGEFTFVSGHTSGIAVTSKSLIMNFVYDRENKETYLHAFDFDGKNRGTIQMSDYNIKDSPYFDCATNNDDILYINTREPYPQILKVRIIYETN